MKSRLEFSLMIVWGFSAAMGGNAPLVSPALPGTASGTAPWMQSGRGSPGLAAAIAEKNFSKLIDDTEDIPVALHEARQLLLVTDFAHKGLTLIHTGLSGQARITDGVNAGYDAAISPDGRYVSYKAFQETEGAMLQAAMLYDIQAKQTLNLSGWQARTGTPSVSSTGKVGFTVGRSLFVLDAKLALEGKFELDGTANLVDFSADGRRVAYSALEGQVHALDLSSGKDERLTRDGRHFYGPAFSPDGKRLLASTADGDVAVFSSIPDGDSESFLAASVRSGTAEPIGRLLPSQLKSPVWLDGNTVGFLKVTVSADAKLHRCVYAMDLAGKSIQAVDIIQEEGNVLIGKQSLFRIRNRVPSRTAWDRGPNGSCLRWNALAPISGRLNNALPEVSRNPGSMLRIGGPLAKAASAAAVRDSVMITTVPYLSQSFDSRDGWNGDWACGGTSAIMTLAYYDKLPKHPLTVKKSVTHVTDYGFYISEKYTFNGTDFSLGSADPDGALGFGGYGYITKNNWQETRQFMADYLKIHGARSEVDWSATLAEAKREIDAKHPIVALTMLTTAGHYIVVIGYMKGAMDGTLIFNDPFGYRADATYRSYRRGIRVKYDMPGTNNGSPNLENAVAFIYSRAEPATTGLRPGAVSIAESKVTAGSDLVNAAGARVKTDKGMARGRYLDIARKAGKSGPEAAGR